jgi:hypothetical protein
LARKSPAISNKRKDVADSLFESDPRFIARIESLRQNYQREGGTSLDDVRKKLRLSQRRRRKK